MMALRETVMRLVLPPELEQFIEEKVQSGDYASAEKVVEDALARWRAEELIDPAQLRRLVAEGQAEADRGELIDAEEVFRKIAERSAQRRGECP
jgi:antitoxin ParD1/3/4